MKSTSLDLSRTVWVLGNEYSPVIKNSESVIFHKSRSSSDLSIEYEEDESIETCSLLCDIQSRVLLTYRTGFAPIQSSTYESDAGWGCMVRAAQMLLANSLFIHHHGRGWRRVKSTETDILDVLSLFGDRVECPYSIHKLSQQGLAFGKKIGQWFDPDQACFAIQRQSKFTGCNDLGIYISDGTCLYIEEILEIAEGSDPDITKKIKKKIKEDQEDDSLSSSSSSSSSVPEENGDETKSESSSSNEEDPDNWKRPVLVVASARLGLETFSTDYSETIIKIFEHPLFVGAIGGRPSSAYYFYGHQMCLNKKNQHEGRLLYLDPHITLPAFDLTPENLPRVMKEYFPQGFENVRCIDIKKIDPSMAFGFYCRNRADLDALLEWNKVALEGLPRAFDFLPSRPSSDVDVIEFD